MKKRNFTTGLVLLGAVLLMSLFLASGWSLAAETPKGEVVYATLYSAFYTVGGDPATHMGGQGPLIATTVFESLVDCAVDLNYLPSVAKSWKMAPDLMSVDFFLKEGIKFHNGDPLTAEDVKFSMETLMRKELRLVIGFAYRDRIKDVEVVAPYHVRFHFRTPAPDLWKRLWWDGAMMPKKYREQVGDKGFADKPIGSGPFKWVDYKQDQYFTMEAVPNHHRKSPGFKTLKIVYVPEHSTRLAMLKAGEVDIAQLIGPHIPVVKSDPNLQFKQIKYTVASGLDFDDLAFPDEPSPLKDRRVRTAVSLAIDRKSICDKILFGGAEPWAEILNPYNLGYDPTVKPDPFDPEKAKALLAEAGYPQGFAADFNCSVTDKYLAEALQASLAQVGIKLDIKLFEGGAWFDAVKGRKLRGMAFRGSWYDAERHPGADVLDGLSSKALWGYVKIPGVDEALDASMSAKNDQEAAEWGRKISKLVRSDNWRVMLWAFHDSYGMSKKIVEWEPQLGSKPGTRFEYMKIKQ
jgi:peptide/nickel transport system substrate-binding protein